MNNKDKRNRYEKISAVLLVVTFLLMFVTLLYQQQRGIVDSNIAAHQLDSNANYVVNKGVSGNDWISSTLFIVTGVLCVAGLVCVGRAASYHIRLKKEDSVDVEN